jgi:hypothetical protein
MSCTFALGGAMDLNRHDVWEMVLSKRLPAGSWAAVATVNIQGWDRDDHEGIDVACELRNGNNVIGGAADRRAREAWAYERRSLTMVGGAQVPGPSCDRRAHTPRAHIAASDLDLLSETSSKDMQPGTSLDAIGTPGGSVHCPSRLRFQCRSRDSNPDAREGGGV